MIMFTNRITKKWQKENENDKKKSLIRTKIINKKTRKRKGIPKTAKILQKHNENDSSRSSKSDSDTFVASLSKISLKILAFRLFL